MTLKKALKRILRDGGEIRRAGWKKNTAIVQKNEKLYFVTLPRENQYLGECFCAKADDITGGSDDWEVVGAEPNTPKEDTTPTNDACRAALEKLVGLYDAALLQPANAAVRIWVEDIARTFVTDDPKPPKEEDDPNALSGYPPAAVLHKAIEELDAAPGVREACEVFGAARYTQADLDAAVVAERERCAKIAHNLAGDAPFGPRDAEYVARCQSRKRTCEIIADKIRGELGP